MAIWVVVVGDSMEAAASEADTMAAPEVTAVGITEAAPMAAAATAAGPRDAATAALLAPVVQLRPDLGPGKAVAAVPKLADPPETSHLMQRPPMEIGTPLARPVAQL